MSSRTCLLAVFVILLAAFPAVADWTLVGWSELGLQCIDPDYAVFALLPPQNTLHAQLLDPLGSLVAMPDAVTVTYEAVADAKGSINRTSQGKTNFWEYAPSLFGAALAPDVGLQGAAMPGSSNAPQPMHFDPAAALFVADGIPITPRDDAGARNSYPLVRLVARDTGGAVLATTDVVLPVSDQLSCATCHASDASRAAEPFEGWVRDPDPQRDVRLNILRLHDDFESGTGPFAQALAAAGYDPAGLYASATAGTPILCARCHASGALPGSGMEGVSPLSRAVHHRMARVADPVTGLLMNAAENRGACYRCHPGAAERQPRGVMGAAVAADGTYALDCQSCHGGMDDVANPERDAWVDEPACQSCHTGTAVRNAGALRYTSVFTPDGSVRPAADPTFATNPQTLYRLSTGHGGLRCEACHGAPHAEYPTAQRNDNLQSEQLQGHAGPLAECSSCHGATPLSAAGGPHGMHPVGAAWVEQHPDLAEEGGAAGCQACHGADYRGTELSRAQGDRVLETDFGRKHFWRGFQIGCYTCHLGPNGEQANPNRAPQVEDVGAATTSARAVDVALMAHDPDAQPLVFRIVDHAQHGTAGLDGATARYIPVAGFVGEDSFTYTASDGSTDGNLATVTITVAKPCPGDCTADQAVTIDELLRGVRMALGELVVGDCASFDDNTDGQVTVNELIRAVDAALNGCA